MRRKKGENGLREREDEEERTEESREKMRKSAPRNRGSERGNVQRETERWRSVAQVSLQLDNWKPKPC